MYMLFYGLDPARFVIELIEVFICAKRVLVKGRKKGIRKERDEDKEEIRVIRDRVERREQE